MASATNRMLWWSLVVSLLVYVVVAHVVSVPANPRAPMGVLATALVAVSGGIAIGTIIYRRRALSGPIQRGHLDPTTPEGQARAFTPFILNLVLSESVGLYGLVLALLSGKAAYATLFVIPALALMYAHRPTAPDLVPPLSGSNPRPADPIG